MAELTLSSSATIHLVSDGGNLLENDSAEGQGLDQRRNLKNDKAISMLAQAFTGESWSQGMGMFGLGDRVSMRNVRASVAGS